MNLSYRFSSKFQMSRQRRWHSLEFNPFGVVPNFTLSLSPDRRSSANSAVGAERWYEKIKMLVRLVPKQFDSQAKRVFQKSLVKDWANGMRHSVRFPPHSSLFQYINVSPSISMNDRMYTRKIRRSWDPAASAEVQDTTYNFYNVFDFNASVSLDTQNLTVSSNY